MSATPDQIAFSLDGVTWTTPVDITAGSHAYSPEIGGVTYPVDLTFTAAVGHTTGDKWKLAYDPADPVGTFAGTALKMTEAAGGIALAGYTPTGIAGELQNIQNAAGAAGQFVYAWEFGLSLRVPATQQLAAAWGLAQEAAVMSLTSNDLSAKLADYETDIGYLMKDIINKRAFLFWHEQAAYYPFSSVLALMLNVNYDLANSTITAKFKAMPGIPTSKITPTDLDVLESKGYSLYTAMQGGVSVVREGNVNQTGWYLDDLINVDNLVNDVKIAALNVFVRNGKVPFTRAGSLLFVSALTSIGEKYKMNGTLADRDVKDPQSESGFKTIPAYIITPAPVYLSTVSDRAARIGPPITMTVYLAGAQHSIAITLSLVQ